HLQPPHHLEWGRRHSEPHITLSGPPQGLTRRGSEPSYLPSVTAGWGWAGAYQGMEPGLEELFSKAEDIGGSSWKSLSLACESSGVLQRVQDSRDIVCGICMDKVWDKPEAKRIFGILPNCSHPHCLGCLRTWRKSRGDFPLGVIKACPQCRVPSSYIIPCKFWVVGKTAFLGGTEPEEEVFFMDCALTMAFWGSELLL
ncbi:hypothetical protein DBR06_SOUSAS1810098, partial [Sousa chinensis]